MDFALSFKLIKLIQSTGACAGTDITTPVPASGSINDAGNIITFVPFAGFVIFCPNNSSCEIFSLSSTLNF